MNPMHESQKAALEQERHTVQMQILECQTAFAELASTTQAYKVVGNFLIAKDAKQLQAELQIKLGNLNVELEAIAKKEKMIG